jgi:serine/threonine protein kinase
MLLRVFVHVLISLCDVGWTVSHPNLVRLLGWATSTECPMVIQEYLAGKALDHQLYVEKWRPTEEDVLKIGLDVARGMEYLHTAFVNLTNHTVPVIHRDLKSPNLLLLYPPDSSSGGGERQQVWVKIADFGLARNKKLDEASRGRAVQTGMMTGCGSVLWMAPEILLGDTYNEKVDVFSYAMCLAELRSGHLPWQGGKSRIDTTQVPYKVTRGQRPTWQLTKGRDKEVKKDFLNALIQRCWDQTPSRRPEFQTIADEIGKQYTAAMRGMRRGSITIDDRPPSPPVIGGSE